MPECVDVSRIPPPDEPGEHFAMGRNARESNRQTGERMVADEVRFLGEKARELLVEYDRLKPEHTLRTFEDVERVWDEVVRPVFKQFRTMQLKWRDDQPELPSDSCWRENSGVPDRS
jgi:hypothetical protein